MAGGGRDGGGAEVTRALPEPGVERPPACSGGGEGIET